MQLLGTLRNKDIGLTRIGHKSFKFKRKIGTIVEEEKRLGRIF